MSGPLAGTTVINAGGVGPGPFASMLLADFGANVIRVDNPSARVPDPSRPPSEALSRGQRSVGLDLKSAPGLDALLTMVDRAEVLIEGFRPGVAERLGFGPQVCLQRNPRLVYGRVTGWGREGEMAPKGGHDINYIALAGVLGHIGGADGPPTPPLNLIGDFAGGGLLLAFGIATALVHVSHHGSGQVVDAAMVDGAALLMTMMYGLRASGMWSDTRGTNLIDGAAPFYGTYETADGHYMAVGAVEPQFFDQLLTGLGYADRNELLSSQYDPNRWKELRRELKVRFRERTRDQWCETFSNLDACVTPVLTMSEAIRHPHNVTRAGFVSLDGAAQPAPAPRFSLTAGSVAKSSPRPFQHTHEVLAELGFSAAEIQSLVQSGAAIAEQHE